MAASLNIRGDLFSGDYPFELPHLRVEKIGAQIHEEVGILTQQVSSRSRTGTQVYLYSSSAVAFMTRGYLILEWLDQSLFEVENP